MTKNVDKFLLCRPYVRIWALVSGRFFAGVVDRQVQHHIGTQEEKHPKDYMGLRKVTYNIPPVAADASLLLSTNR